MSVTPREDDRIGVQVGEGRTSIPVRNLWLLFLYASQLYEHLHDEERVLAETNPAGLVELASRILCGEADRALRRNLSVGYVERHEVLTAVRDRIDHLGTARGAHLQRGHVLCRFDHLTVDTARNRYIAAALAQAGRRLGSSRIDPHIANQCLALASRFERSGVRLDRPNPDTPRRAVYGHYDRHDRRTMAAAQLVIDTLLPTHAAGQSHVNPLDYSQGSLRKLYEQAIRNFYRVNLPDWQVGARHLSWPSDGPLDPLFPAMRTDITLDRPDRTRLIIDTKFTSALSTHAEHHEPRLHSGHLYQLYAYLHTQAGRGDPSADHADGLLLYPSTDQAPDINVTATMREHALRVATVDLTATPTTIRARLLNMAVTQGATIFARFEAVPPPEADARN